MNSVGKDAQKGITAVNRMRRLPFGDDAVFPRHNQQSYAVTPSHDSICSWLFALFA